jgi:hypothetical protein
MSAEMLPVTLAVHEAEFGYILASRIASRRLTLGFQMRPEWEEIAERRSRYRASILHTIYSAASDHTRGSKLLSTFQRLADNLENAKAMAIPTDIPVGTGFNDAWRALLHRNDLTGDISNVEPHEVCDHLLHPLSVALLAYHMGGPVNAGTIPPHAHRWKLPDDSATAIDPQSFHMEGDDKSIFADHRITLVWEELNGQSKGASGQHHVFLSGNVTDSTPLETAYLVHASHTQAASIILYDQHNAALVYESQQKDAVRHSLSLDFMLQTGDDNLFDLFTTPKAVPIKLSTLLLGHPTPNYGYHFERLLFAPASLEALVGKLSSVDMAEVPCTTIDNFMEKANAWHNEERARIPASICLEYDTRITCVSTSKDNLLSCLSHRAFRDLHMHIGCDFFPENTVEEFREYARLWIRDMSFTQVSQRLACYKTTLGTVPFATSGMLPTSQLHGLSLRIARKCRELIGSGFIDPTGVLASLPFFVSALGKALNGPKQIETVQEFEVGFLDLQTYRTRCLYLFLCADWLMQYSNTPVRGLCMLPDADKVLCDVTTGGYKSNTIQLLQNWIIWGLLMENLPPLQGLVIGRLKN